MIWEVKIKYLKRTTFSTLSKEYLEYLLFVISAKEKMAKQTEDLLNKIYNINSLVITIINMKIQKLLLENIKKQ